MHADSTSLVLERLPNGEYAWLRPEPERCTTCGGPLTQSGERGGPCEFGHPLHQDEPDDDERVSLTQRGQDYLARERAMEALFGEWPTMAQAFALVEVA